ncbi:hypothetical protein QBC35DRAFT_257760 [Podospora australis]|uniref:Chitin-binding type-4 domain-containing protein n=1 Tax=Podospora australis TaxID=1536484 RepID=A0AAN7AM96_9PEZI|nr:hypothetical protein QBC35DRAFT_257760 [Podospora australis]
MFKSLLFMALVATVSAHGNITSPPARLPGPAMVEACGQAAVDSILADGGLPIESVVNPLDSCNLFFCRGALLDDNIDIVQEFFSGQVVNLTSQLPIPHEGPANVSIVLAATNKILGEPLLVFDSYADENLPELPANNTAFSITIPDAGSGVEEACVEAGDCALQWFWFGTGAQQTYESCIDFVIVNTDDTTATKRRSTRSRM